MSRHHLVISGTGRAGTTFLVQLFTELGLETGFADQQQAVFPNCHAGMESDLRRADAPYVVKSPWLCDHLDEIMESGEVVVDHAIVPVRDLFAAAESRRDVTARTDPSIAIDGIVPGGLWHTSDPNAQEQILMGQLYKLIWTITRFEIPLTLLHFPRIIHDPDYLFRQIAGLLPDELTESDFQEAFGRVARPELVHPFEKLRRTG